MRSIAGKNSDKHRDGDKNRGTALLILLLAAIFLSCISMIRADSIMLSEVVSSESNQNSRSPSIAIGPVDPYVIHIAWEDDTELNASIGGSNIRNGQDKDILYTHKNRTEWSTLQLEDGKMKGGVQVVSNSSITSSKNPDITVDYHNITHIVWEGITKPAELAVDDYTTFLMRFEDSDLNADYALGSGVPLLSNGVTLSHKGMHNMSAHFDSSDNLVYPAEGNFNSTHGTVEFWYNPDHYGYSGKKYCFFHAYNLSIYPLTEILSICYSDDVNYFFQVYRNLINGTRSEYYYYPAFGWGRNELHHIAFAYNFSRGECRFYVDGFLAYSNLSCGNYSGRFDNFTIGLNQRDISQDSLAEGGSYPVEGEIDEFRLTNKVLSGDEIRADAGQFDIFHRSLNGSTWSDTDVVTSGDSNNSYFPRLSFDKNSTLSLVWNIYHNQSLSKIGYRRKFEKGSWLDAETVSAGTRAYFPDISVDEHNNSHVVWADVDDSSGNFTQFSTIMYRMRNQTAWGGIENVSNRTFDPVGHNVSANNFFKLYNLPRIASGADNTTHVVWQTLSGFPDDDLLFYVNFDDMSANVTFSNKTTLSHQNGTQAFSSKFNASEPNVNMNKMIRTGFALHVNASGYANYSAIGNINHEHGTIMLWFRMDRYIDDLPAGEAALIFEAASSNTSVNDADEIIALYVQKCNSNEQSTCGDSVSLLLVFLLYDNTSTANRVRYNISSIATATTTDDPYTYLGWNHVAVTWNLSAGNNASLMYVNGEMVQHINHPNTDTKIYFNSSPTEFIIGNAFVTPTSVDAYALPLNGTIDEVMVFGRILPEEEIAIYAEPVLDLDIAYKQKNDSGWQKPELLSSATNNDHAVYPSIATKDGNAYASFTTVMEQHYCTDVYPFCSLSKTTFRRRNSTSWSGIEFPSDENVKGTASSDIAAGRPGKIDIVWEDRSVISGDDVDVYYREYTNSTTPSVSIEYPLGGEVFSANFNVNASASDPDSTPNNVSFYYTADRVSGNTICTDTSSPFKCLWSVLTTSEDIYRVKAIVTASDGGRNWSMTNSVFLDSSAAVKMYTFNETGNSLGSNSIYALGYGGGFVLTTRPDVTNSSSLGEDVTDDARANVSSTEEQYYRVSRSEGCGGFNYSNAIVFKLYINDTPGNLSVMKIRWTGYGYPYKDYLTNMSVWNFGTGDWETLDYKNFAESINDDLTYTITSGFSDYLDTEENKMYVLVETLDYYSYACRTTWNLVFNLLLCPLYLSWNGSAYEFEVEGILGMFSPGAERPTYDRLKKVRAENGTVKIAIKEIMDETTYMDSVELITVDHREDAEAMLDIGGTPRAIVNPKKVSCTDRHGDDCTGLIGSMDEAPRGASSSIDRGLVGSRSVYDDPLGSGPEGSYWVSDLSAADFDPSGETRDYITLQLPEPDEDEKDSDIIKLIIAGSDTGFLGLSEAALFMMAGESLPHLYNILDNTRFGKLADEGISEAVPMRIEVFDPGRGKWEDYPERFSNALLGSYKTIIIPLNRSLVNGGKIRINMIAYGYMLDYAAVDYSSDELETEDWDVRVSKLDEASKAGIASPGDSASLRESDDIRMKIRKGDIVELSFSEPAQPDTPGMERSYFLMTEGYYHPGELSGREDSGIREISGSLGMLSEAAKVDGWMAYYMMISDPSYAERYMLESYLEQALGRKPEPSGPRDSNTLNNDFFSVTTTSSCVMPVDNMEIWTNTSFCPDMRYTVSDADGDGAIIKIMGNDITLDCQGSALDGGGSIYASRNQGYGVGIGMNHTYNVTVKNCTVIGYGIGIGMNYSVGSRIENNTILNSYVGMGGEATNDTLVMNNIITNHWFVGCSFIRGSTNNTIRNNTVQGTQDFLLGFALDNADNNTIEFNTINGSADSALTLAGIITMRNADSNTIRNNMLDNLYAGIGMADVGTFLSGASYGYSGQRNNYSSNIMTRMVVAGIGFAYPYDTDYYNYFDQNNMVNGEKVYYYYDVHGNATDYVQVNGLNLTAHDVSIFSGKLTFANCSYINITNSNVSDNFYGMLAIKSNNIIFSNNRAYNHGDSMLNMRNTYYPTGSGIVVINSDGINLSHNNASSNIIGFFIEGSTNISMINNTAWSNTDTGFFINNTNSSFFYNNTAWFNNLFGFYFKYSNMNFVWNNTAKDNMQNITTSGFYFGPSFNNSVLTNIAFNNTRGFMFNASNETFANNTVTNSTAAGVMFLNCLAGQVINDSSNIVENNTGDGYYFSNCNSTFVSGLNMTRNAGAGFTIYGSGHLSMSRLWSKNNYYGYMFNSSANNTLANSYSINSTSNEIYFYSSTDNMIANSYITNNVSGYDINSTTNSWNYAVNTSFNTSNLDNGGNSNVSIQWYLDLYVLDNESVPVAAASVSLNDSLTTDYIYTATTGTDARARLNLTEYTSIEGGKTYFSNYTWNITKEGYMSNVSVVNMSQNREINVTINLLGGVADTSSPTNPVVYDGYNYVDYDWTNNASVLFASWSNSTDRHLIFYGYRVLENGTCISTKCAPTEVDQDTQTMITGLTLKEGYNYSIGVRARDTNYYYSSFIYSDGIIADFTPPNVSLNSSTNPNTSQWYSSPNVTFDFYGNDTLSGIAAYSYMLDQNSGTGPDLVEETRPDMILQEMTNTGGSKTLRDNSTGSAFTVFNEIDGNISVGDNVTVKVPLIEDASDTLDEMTVRVYLLSKDTAITAYDMENLKISTMQTLNLDINSKSAVSAGTYSFNVIATRNSTDSFYVAVATSTLDDNNTHNISIAGRSTGADNATSSYYCEEGVSSCSNTTLTFDYAMDVRKKDTRDIWHKSYTNLANGEHWFHVRAQDVAGNWGSVSHHKVRIDAVNGTPLFSLVKPVGYIATTEPLLVADTNEYTTCYYNTTNMTYTAMTSYDGLHHEIQLSGLSSTTYTYSFNCTDRAGNSAYNDTTFIVDPDAVPDNNGVSVFTMGNYTVGKTVNVFVNVTKTYNSVPYGLGELAGYFSANITNLTDGSSYSINIDVTDNGNGLYTVSFEAPLSAGSYKLTITVRGKSGTKATAAFSASTHTLTIRYSGGGINYANTKTRMVYSIYGSSYIVGLAGDASTATTAGSTTSQLQIAGPAIIDNLYMFMTRTTSEPADVARYLDGGSFMDLSNPAFGYQTAQKDHVVSTMLEYDSISIVGSREVQSGRYTLLIKNEGVNQTTGKTKVSVSII